MQVKSLFFLAVFAALSITATAHAGMAAVMPKGYKCADGTVLKKDDVCPRTPERKCPQPTVYLPDGSCRKAVIDETNKPNIRPPLQKVQWV